MTITLGVDVSKSFLDVFDSLSHQCRRFENTDTGVTQLLDTYAHHPPEALRVVMESTGHYQQALVLASTAKGLLTYVVNPYRVRQFARAMGRRAKTDKLDAQTICAFGQTMDLPAMEPRSETLLQMTELLRARTCLKTELTALKLHASTHRSTPSKAYLEACIHPIEIALRALETEIRQLVAADATVLERYTLLTSAPGIGEVCAWTLLAFLPELGRCHRQAIAALVGVAPWVVESGTLKGKARIGGGRQTVRNTLYMGVMGSICHKRSWLYTDHQRLTHAGKPFKVAAIACLRKLLVRLNCMMRNNELWRD